MKRAVRSSGRHTGKGDSEAARVAAAHNPATAEANSVRRRRQLIGGSKAVTWRQRLDEAGYGKSGSEAGSRRWRCPGEAAQRDGAADA